MYTSTIFAAVSAIATLASPALAVGCMTKSQATQVANNFKDLINLPFNTTLAKSAMTKNFHDYSDSVIELINNGCPNGPVALGSATFSSRSAFIAGQSGQPPIPWENLNVWHTCDTVIVRWVSSAPGTVSPEQQVQGIVVLETVPNSLLHPDQPWLIKTVYSEFNSGAWLYDLGIFTPSNCSSSTGTTSTTSTATTSTGTTSTAAASTATSTS